MVASADLNLHSVGKIYRAAAGAAASRDSISLTVSGNLSPAAGCSAMLGGG